MIDTAIVFPDRRGPPFKRPLRSLTLEYLQKIIQEDGKYIYQLIVPMKFRKTVNIT